ncbi:Cyclopropane-fatty-acyl-phospholipid synthase [Caenorhabditis elegans]|uniref:Cyclopropane-fatty-acyl-phospholipid synthase n=2 Tax=Caenorhabditis elegans TaxID=6239 RepID=A0A8S4SS59_CAEEL|nr:Cyclopropane-fatty-acyl-phospholipid synthase [Caenorhabditis elegans]CAH2655648.1 Cyclopropane-fatty-acyl-phospholipid synthase [Caenorhabditis elegans]
MMTSETSSRDMKTARAGPSEPKSFLYNFIVSHLCIPSIRRFFVTFLAKSSERLILQIPAVDYTSEFGNAAEPNNNAQSKPVLLTIHNPIHFCWLMLLDPKMGLGETYMADDWSCSPNPTEFLRLLIRSKKQTQAAYKAQYGDKPRTKSFGSHLTQFSIDGVRKIAKVVNYVQHWLLENTISQSARNIQAHYDLGNDMFKLFLDKSMTYSSALFDEVKPVTDVDFVELEKAQYKKIDRLIDQLELKADDHVLEIGCGWGAAAIRAVQRSGCKWTGITISKEQLEWGQKKVVEAGLEGRIELKFQDYRLVKEKYTRVVSIEMIEAVGEKYLPQYFQIINDVLTDGGIAALQAITCPDAYYDQYRSSSDFIKKYIFPGGHLPSLGAISQSLPKTLKQTDLFSMGHHYSMTLEHWFFAWMKAKDEIEKMNLPFGFHRRWQFYFCLCAALFAHDHIDVVQLTFKKNV